MSRAGLPPEAPAALPSPVTDTHCHLDVAAEVSGLPPAEALRRAGTARRVAIIDWDVHHGDGTQAIFQDDPDVCYASSHQSPLFPGTGERGDRGRGDQNYAVGA